MKVRNCIQSLLIATATVIISSAASFAAETAILTVSSDAIPKVASLLAVTDDSTGDLVGLKYGTKYVTRGQIQQGAILVKVEGHDVIGVKGNIDPREGGTITMTYLKNGITGSKGKYQMRLSKAGTQLTMYTVPGNNLFDALFLAKNTLFGKLIGISRVTPSYRGSNL